jgi:CheY-like chemotaxis protein
MANILIIEDYPDNRDITELILAAAGHTVASASDALRGLYVAARDQPDLIVMDLALPRLDGWEAMRRLNAYPLTRHIPVVAVTAHVSQADRARAAAAGCVAVIVNTAFAIRRSEYDVRIGYSDDIAQAKHLIVDAIKSADGVLQEPQPETLVMDLAPSGVHIRARWWTKSRRVEVLTAQDHVITAIKNTLLEHGIDLPFPTQQILFHDQTEETDGDRLRQREGWRAGTGPVPRPGSIAGSLRKLAEARMRYNGDRTRHTEKQV